MGHGRSRCMRRAGDMQEMTATIITSISIYFYVAAMLDADGLQVRGKWDTPVLG